MKTKTLMAITLVLILASCTSPTVRIPMETENAIASFASTPPLPTVTPTPPIESGKGRITLDLEMTPQEVVVRHIIDDFLIGVGTTGPGGCVSNGALRKFRIGGLNYFLPFTPWASIERSSGNYTKQPCPGDEFINYAAQSGATLNGHCTVFLMNAPWLIPSYAYDRSYEEQKQMMESFIKAVVQRYPQITIWTLNEPVSANAFGWSRNQIYDFFVSASQWIHETNPKAKVMINMIPIPNQWSGIYYDPNQVLDDLFGRGMQVDIIGIEYYYSFFADALGNSYPTMKQVKAVINEFRKYHLPIIFSEVGVPGVINGKDNYEQQAQWLEDFFRLAHADPDVIGAVWYFVIDDGPHWNFYGLANYDYSLRPAGNRLMVLAEEWNPSTTYYLNNKNYLDLAPGKYDVVIDGLLNQVSVIDGQVTTISIK